MGHPGGGCHGTVGRGTGRGGPGRTNRDGLNQRPDEFNNRFPEGGRGSDHGRTPAPSVPCRGPGRRGATERAAGGRKRGRDFDNGTPVPRVGPSSPALSRRVHASTPACRRHGNVMDPTGPGHCRRRPREGRGETGWSFARAWTRLKRTGPCAPSLDHTPSEVPGTEKDRGLRRRSPARPSRARRVSSWRGRSREPRRSRTRCRACRPSPRPRRPRRSRRRPSGPSPSRP